jgi:hypothetical protein
VGGADRDALPGARVLRLGMGSPGAGAPQGIAPSRSAAMRWNWLGKVRRRHRGCR